MLFSRYLVIDSYWAAIVIANVVIVLYYGIVN